MCQFNNKGCANHIFGDEGHLGVDDKHLCEMARKCKYSKEYPRATQEDTGQADSESDSESEYRNQEVSSRTIRAHGMNMMPLVENPHMAVEPAQASLNPRAYGQIHPRCPKHRNEIGARGQYLKLCHILR